MFKEIKNIEDSEQKTSCIFGSNFFTISNKKMVSIFQGTKSRDSRSTIKNIVEVDDVAEIELFSNHSYATPQ